jgi:hypothetical protein
MTKKIFNILVVGASYGSLLAIKFLAAGHNVTMTCRTATADLMNLEGIRVRLPIKGRKDIGIGGVLEINSGDLPGLLHASTPQLVRDLGGFDLVVLAMQEPQYRQDGIRQLMAGIAQAGLPCMPIMNMPPMPYLKRLQKHNGHLDASACADAYADASVWEGFDPELMTLSSPDPQAFRPMDEPVNVLQVALATNFKVARFESDIHTQVLQQLEADIDAVRINVNGEAIELPVKLKVFESLFVPLSKWSMLMTGNYRCIEDTKVRPICEAVLGNREESQAVYEWVAGVCMALGGAQDDLVTFAKYADAAEGLPKPSSAARALASGATYIERVDMVVQTLAAQLGMRNTAIDQTVRQVDGWLNKNRSAVVS